MLESVIQVWKTVHILACFCCRAGKICSMVAPCPFASPFQMGQLVHNVICEVAQPIPLWYSIETLLCLPLLHLLSLLKH
jgi:hypothetical protein